MDAADIRRALVGLIASYQRRHGRLPSRAAVLDVYRMLCAPPRSEDSAAEAALPRVRDGCGADVSPWRD